ncbi:MAG: CAP domain-containing protein [Comamonadaceae bacterium]|nr:MAG: CAP domain-containing protein [Comamonadaceae bacterium]
MKNIRLAALSIASALVVVLGAVPAEAVTTTSWQNQVFDQSNKERKAKGVKVTKRSACLDKYTKSWIKNVYEDNKLTSDDHRTSGSLLKVLKKCGYSTIGENLAMGQTSGKEVVKDWMGSSGHRKNLLNKKFSVIGVASIKKGGKWWTVQLLAGK